MKTRVVMVAVLCAALLFQTATVFALDGGASRIEKENGVTEEDKTIKYNAIGEWSEEYDSTYDDFVYTYANRPAGLQFSVPYGWEICDINVKNLVDMGELESTEDFMLRDPDTESILMLESYETPEGVSIEDYAEFKKERVRENGYDVIDSYITNEFTPDGGEWYAVKCVKQDESGKSIVFEEHSRITDYFTYQLTGTYYEGSGDGIDKIFDSLQEVKSGYYSPVGFGASDGFWLFDQYYNEELGITFTIPDGWKLSVANEVCPDYEEETLDRVLDLVLSGEGTRDTFAEEVMDNISQYTLRDFCLTSETFDTINLLRIDTSVAGKESLSDQELADYYMDYLKNNFTEVWGNIKEETDFSRTIAGREYWGMKLKDETDMAYIYLFQREGNQLYYFLVSQIEDDPSSYEQFFDAIGEYTLTEGDIKAEAERAWDKAVMQTDDNALWQSDVGVYTDEDAENGQTPDYYAGTDEADDYSDDSETIYLEPTFFNSTDMYLQEIYMSPQSSTEWGECLAQEIDISCPSDPFVLYVDLSDALYDIKVVDIYGEEYFGTIDFSDVVAGEIGSTEFGGTNVIEISIEDDGSLGCYIF